jgi:hypothetical protein
MYLMNEKDDRKVGSEKYFGKKERKEKDRRGERRRTEEERRERREESRKGKNLFDLTAFQDQIGHLVVAKGSLRAK